MQAIMWFSATARLETDETHPYRSENEPCLTPNRLSTYQISQRPISPPSSPVSVGLIITASRPPPVRFPAAASFIAVRPRPRLPSRISHQSGAGTLQPRSTRVNTADHPLRVPFRATVLQPSQTGATPPPFSAKPAPIPSSGSTKSGERIPSSGSAKSGERMTRMR